jgi:hypothetical protein
VLNILGSDSEDEDENEEDTTEADVSYRVAKKTLWKFNRLLCITNLAKQFNFYIGRKRCYLAFQ